MECFLSKTIHKLTQEYKICNIFKTGMGVQRKRTPIFKTEYEQKWRTPPIFILKFDKWEFLCYNKPRNKLVTNEIKCLKTQHKCNTYCIKCYESTGKRWMKQTTEVHQ